MSGNILSPDEYKILTTIPDDIEDSNLVRFFTLTPTDFSLSDPRLPPTYRFDQVAYVCILRWLGWTPGTIEHLPEIARVALCRQLEITIERITPLAE